MTDEDGQSLRLRQAQTRFADAVVAEAQARQAAEPAVARRGRRRAAGIRLAVIAAVIAAIGLAGAGWFAHRGADHALARAADTEAARVAAEHAIVTMLTADPAHADRYVDEVMSISTGDQRVRVQGSRAGLVALVAGLPQPTTGQILSAASVGESDVSGDRATSILLVAQTTGPELVGGDAGQSRVGLAVTMVRVGERWLVRQAEAVS
ncbi:hypothetical protein [Gordonia aichiensis]|uniref:hypothetical protein n=2 Tax=Gordonia TaxID=2053 RepID=UPI00326661E7